MKPTSKALYAGALIVLLASLTACADNATPSAGGASPKPSAVASQPPFGEIDLTPMTESEPGSSQNRTDLTPADELPDEVRAKLPATPTAKPTAKDHHAERQDTKFSGKMPENFTVPPSGELFGPASVIDGDRSFIALSFDLSWESVATTLKDSLKKDGWVCVTCEDYMPVTRTAGNQNIKYVMEMTNGDRTLYVAITASNGQTGAGLNFQP